MQGRAIRDQRAARMCQGIVNETADNASGLVIARRACMVQLVMMDGIKRLSTWLHRPMLQT